MSSNIIFEFDEFKDNLVNLIKRVLIFGFVEMGFYLMICSGMGIYKHGFY